MAGGGACGNTTDSKDMVGGSPINANGDGKITARGSKN